jgi:hypothetical protein
VNFGHELVRPVEQLNSNAFAIMAVADQMAASFLLPKPQAPGKDTRTEAQ